MKKVFAVIISLLFVAALSFAVVGCKKAEEQKPAPTAAPAPAPGSGRSGARACPGSTGRSGDKVRKVSIVTKKEPAEQRCSAGFLCRLRKKPGYRAKTLPPRAEKIWTSGEEGLWDKKLFYPSPEVMRGQNEIRHCQERQRTRL